MNVDDTHFGIDALVARLVPCEGLPPDLAPRHLLEDDVVPPDEVAGRVYALRALVRSGGDDTPLSGRLADSRSVARYFGALLRGERSESLWIVGCDIRNRVRFHRCVATGGATRCSVSIADILRPLVLNACPAAVLVHPHPSGDPGPSAEDVELTQRVREACTLLGIHLLDHVIVGGDGHFSFLDAGML